MDYLRQKSPKYITRWFAGEFLVPTPQPTFEATKYRNLACGLKKRNSSYQWYALQVWLFQLSTSAATPTGTLAPPFPRNRTEQV